MIAHFVRILITKNIYLKRFFLKLFFAPLKDQKLQKWGNFSGREGEKANFFICERIFMYDSTFC